FEAGLWDRILRLACGLVRLFLAARRARADLRPHLAGGTHRLGDPAAARRLDTRFGAVTYARPYLIRRDRGPGYHPLDAQRGRTPSARRRPPPRNSGSGGGRGGPAPGVRAAVSGTAGRPNGGGGGAGNAGTRGTRARTARRSWWWCCTPCGGAPTAGCTGR